MKSDLRSPLASWVPLVVVGLGLWLYAPTLDLPFMVDDTLHVAQLQGAERLPPRGPLDLYVFVDGAPDPMGPVQGSYVPWWGRDDLVVAFLRPLSSLTHGIDFALYGASPRGFHLTNLVLYALVSLAAWRLYAEWARDTGRGAGTVLLAGALFVLDAAHVDNVSWIAARYTLVTVAFCVLALLQYHRWRRDGRTRSLAFSMTWLVAALFASEAAVAFCAWVFAYEVCLARGSVRERAGAMVPFALVVGAFLAAYALAGFGTHGSSVYVDPLDAPLRWLGQALRSVPRLVTMALTSTDMAAGLARWGPGVALAIAGILAVGLRRDRLSTFALLGSLLGLVPLGASPLHEHGLLLASVGIAWVAAAFVSDSVRDGSRWVRGEGRPDPASALFALPRFGLALGILGMGLWVDPAAVRSERLPAIRARAELRVALSREAELPTGAQAEDARVLLLTAPDVTLSLYLPMYRLLDGHGWPGGIWPISVSLAPHRVARTGPRRLRLSVRSPFGFLHHGFAGIFTAGADYRVGDRFRRGALEVTIVDTFTRGDDPQERVRAIELELDRRLDAPDVWLLVWDGERWKRIPAPPVGEGIRLPRRRFAEPGVLRN